MARAAASTVVDVIESLVPQAVTSSIIALLAAIPPLCKPLHETRAAAGSPAAARFNTVAGQHLLGWPVREVIEE
jgi:hypothetical protein